MAFWNRNKQPETAAPVEQAILIHLPGPLDADTGLDEVELPIIEAVARTGTGEFDGNAIGPDGAVLYVYGPDADALWGAIGSAVRNAPIGPDAYAVKRYGGPGSSETRIDLT